MIQNHVTSLETSKRLKDLGVPQKSYFMWKHNTQSPQGEIDEWQLVNYQGSNFSESYYHVSAFLASELGGMLPEWLLTNAKGRMLIDETTPVKLNRNEFRRFIVDKKNTEAEGRGKMLIFLIEKEFISFKK